MICNINNYIDSDEIDRVWYWSYKDVKLYYDIGEDIKCKVLEMSFKSKNEISSLSKVDDLQEKIEFSFENIMDVICTVNQEGLGPIKWWK